MKRTFIISLVCLFAATFVVGCKSGSSCFTRNGSRVPFAAADDTTSVGAAVAPVAVAGNGYAAPASASPYNEVMMMQATSATSACEPCAPSACTPCSPCNPCDPCSATTARTSAYPGM
ncbi:MAG: hypothetical protein HUK22_01580 [Thermoguttaceae bacterium]|nr:hypothetical protein [Thermoguttaceae bacterium]